MGATDSASASGSDTSSGRRVLASTPKEEKKTKVIDSQTIDCKSGDTDPKPTWEYYRDYNKYGGTALNGSTRNFVKTSGCANYFLYDYQHKIQTLSRQMYPEGRWNVTGDVAGAPDGGQGAVLNNPSGQSTPQQKAGQLNDKCKAGLAVIAKTVHRTDYYGNVTLEHSAECVELTKYQQNVPKCEAETNTIKGTIITNDANQSEIQVDYCNITESNTTTFIEMPCTGTKPWAGCNATNGTFSCATEYLPCSDFYTQYAAYQENLQYQYFKLGMLLFFVGVILVLFIIMVTVVGFWKVFARVFYIVSFHWVLKAIISYRRGVSIKDKIDKELKIIIENDEEMAKIMVETDNGDLLEEDPDDKNKNKKISKNRENDRRKEIARKKKLLKLKKEYENCLAGDKFSNDEDKIRYENSSQIMVKAIEFLKQKEYENFYIDYVNDLKRAFGSEDRKKAGEGAIAEEDANFVGSNIELADFRIFQEFNKIENKKLQKSVIEIINVRCTDLAGLDRFERRGERTPDLGNQELRLSNKSRRASEASGPRNRRGGNAVVPELKLAGKKSSRSSGRGTLFPPIKGAAPKPK